jgi:hypothetical protein
MRSQLQLAAVSRVLAAGVASAAQDRPQLAIIAFVLRCASLCLMALTLLAAPAVAQARESPVNITAFAGVAMAPGPHPAIGVAVGHKPRPGPVSLEFEHWQSRRDPVAGAPAIGHLPSTS